jgi:folate-binding Fe-S cluster repair protein YgfZ
MLNYDLTGHVSFTKGCYTGQEVVARMHYRGKPKRRLYRAQLAQGQASPGDALYADSSAQSVGNVAGAADTGDGGQSLLVVATADGASAGLHLDGIDGPTLLLQPLPYSLDPDAGS